MLRVPLLVLSAVISLPSSVYASDDDNGKALFEEKCAMCHRAMGMGTWQLERRVAKDVAWLENREDLNVPFVKHVVRNGLGIMFSISRAEVSDPQLDAIADYLAKEQEK